MDSCSPDHNFPNKCLTLPVYLRPFVACHCIATGLAHTGHVEKVVKALRAEGLDVTVYDEVRVEPTDTSFKQAARFAIEGKFDGYVSVGMYQHLLLFFMIFPLKFCYCLHPIHMR